jgi:hypothetical protein
LTAELETSREEGPDPRAALERFVLDNEDLARLEELTGQFNFFEAVGMVWQEIRHSNFLAWLLSPAQNHGLGDSFLKAFLTKTSVKARACGIEGTISPVDVDAWDLTGTEVRREWEYIDITLVDESNKLVCVIENKVRSGEHGDQLRRYREEVVEPAFHDWRRHYVFLNVTGDEPSDPYYVGVTYDEVCQVIERLLKVRASAVGDDVALALSHYVTMVRRRVMPDTEIQELCRRIYRKHQAALDLIYEHRPDRQAAISGALLEMIGADPAFALDVSQKAVVRFVPDSWKDSPELQQSRGWTKTGRILLFEFFNSVSWHANALALALTLGPGDEGVRRRIYEAAEKTGSPFRASPKGLHRRHQLLFWKEVLSTAEYDELDLEAIQSRLREAWSEFKSEDLPPIKEAIDQLFS